MTKLIILKFKEHAEHFRWAQNVHNLEFNILILDLNPFIWGVFAAEPFLEIDKLILRKKSLLLIENLIYIFKKNILKHDKNGKTGLLF